MPRDSDYEIFTLLHYIICILKDTRTHNHFNKFHILYFINIFQKKEDRLILFQFTVASLRFSSSVWYFLNTGALYLYYKYYNINEEDDSIVLSENKIKVALSPKITWKFSEHDSHEVYLAVISRKIRKEKRNRYFPSVSLPRFFDSGLRHFHPRRFPSTRRYVDVLY